MVETRAPGTEQISQRVSYYKKKRNALWGGGDTHRSWPGGRGGRPRALVAGEGWGGRRGDGSSKEGEGWGLVGFQRGASPGKGSGKGWLGGPGGCKGFGLFLKDALWGGEGYPPELDFRGRGRGKAWCTGGQGGGARVLPLFQESRPLIYPPSTRPEGYPPHPTGHPSKKAMFLLFVHVRNDKKYDTRCEICSPLHPPPGKGLPTRAGLVDGGSGRRGKCLGGGRKRFGSGG